MLYHTVRALAGVARVDLVCVVLSPGDEHFDGHDWSVFGQRLKVLRCGGDTRAQSVINGLKALQTELTDDDWVLVHDAARPCIAPLLVDRLIDEVGDDPVGGLLGLPLPDTLKQADDSGRVQRTVPRAGLWLAQTPQMFRYGLLVQALTATGAGVTDDASAVEALGLKPRLVTGDSRNFKVTYAADAGLAELILQSHIEPRNGS